MTVNGIDVKSLDNMRQAVDNLANTTNICNSVIMANMYSLNKQGLEDSEKINKMKFELLFDLMFINHGIKMLSSKMIGLINEAQKKSG